MGDESKLARSFERIRSIVRKRRKETSENDCNSKLEKLVHEIVIKQRHEKKGILVDTSKKYMQEQVPLYSQSYQVTKTLINPQNSH